MDRPVHAKTAEALIGIPFYFAAAVDDESLMAMMLKL